MALYSLVWQQKLVLVAMKLIQQARECVKMKKNIVLKVALAAKKSLRIVNYAEVQVLMRSEKQCEHLLTPKSRCW